MWFWVLIAVWLLGWLCIPHLLLLNKRPTATLAWLWAILLFPLFGAGLYLMIGTERVKRRRRNRRRGFRGGKGRVSVRSAAAETAALLAKETSLDPENHLLLETLSTITQLPVATVSDIRVLRKAPAFYGALREDIQNARHDVQVESYVWRDDEVGRDFLKVLCDAARRGVAVRVLLDELGSLLLKEGYFHSLVEAGGEFSWCHTLSPLRNRYAFNLRNHRKLQVIDDHIAYVGGINFGREYLGCDPAYGDWGDLQIRVEGSVVAIFHQIFAEDWFFATGRDDIREVPLIKENKVEKTFAQVLRGGPDEEDQPMLRVNIALVAAARKRLWISTGYFVPGEIMQAELQVAAARGVDVRLLVSEKSQHPYLVKAGRSYYDALMRHGVRIYEYEKGVEHSKFMIIDEHWTSVGSSNLDERSMRLNFELSLLTFHAKTNEELSRIFEQVIQQSNEIHQHIFARRPYSEKLIEAILRPLSPVL